MLERLPTPDLIAQARAITFLLLDVDGVLTPGTVTYTDAGDEIKTFHVRDGSAIKMWRDAGHGIAIISGRKSAAVNRRAQELGIEIVHQGVADKWPVLEGIVKQLGIRFQQVATIGDDWADVPVAQGCGLSIAVNDAIRELKDIAGICTHTPGGLGAVREAIEWILRAQGRWEAAIAKYTNRIRG